VTVYFFDSSGIVKRYLVETGTTWVSAYDAVQLAAALTLNAELSLVGASPLTLVSADGPLNTAAITEGLAVDDPNTHP
jgi:predicted nucleic acid-binding protein